MGKYSLADIGQVFLGSKFEVLRFCFWLRSSMVERATHNRLVTGSNPVGAKL